MDINNITISGRIGSTPELRNTTGGTPACEVNIATTSWNKTGNNGNGEEESHWTRIKLFGRNAERITNPAQFEKGQKICITGELRQETWTDKNTGAERSAHSILVNRLVPITYPKNQPQQQYQPAPPQQHQPQYQQPQQQSAEYTQQPQRPVRANGTHPMPGDTDYQPPTHH